MGVALFDAFSGLWQDGSSFNIRNMSRTISAVALSAILPAAEVEAPKVLSSETAIEAHILSLGEEGRLRVSDLINAAVAVNRATLIDVLQVCPVDLVYVKSDKQLPFVTQDIPLSFELIVHDGGKFSVVVDTESYDRQNQLGFFGGESGKKCLEGYASEFNNHSASLNGALVFSGAFPGEFISCRTHLHEKGNVQRFLLTCGYTNLWNPMEVTGDPECKDTEHYWHLAG